MFHKLAAILFLYIFFFCGKLAEWMLRLLFEKCICLPAIMSVSLTETIKRKGAWLYRVVGGWWSGEVLSTQSSAAH